MILLQFPAYFNVIVYLFSLIVGEKSRLQEDVDCTSPAKVMVVPVLGSTIG
jgi:hypothetical protein